MRANIRTTYLGDLRADAEAAVAQLDIDETATYHQLLVITQPQFPTARQEDTLPGSELRGVIRTLLLTAMHEVEQYEPDTITVSWTRKTKRNHYRTHICRYTKVR